MMNKRNASGTCTVIEQLEIRLEERHPLEECEKPLHALHMAPRLCKIDQKFHQELDK